jgi:hypothetical protein
MLINFLVLMWEDLHGEESCREKKKDIVEGWEHGSSSRAFA